LKTHSLLRFRSRPTAGPSDAFRDLVLAHLDGAYSLACYLTRDPVLSEDIVQDAVVRAFRAFDQYRGGSSRAWLLAIVRNCCRTAQAARGGGLGLVVQEIGGEEDHADPSPTPEDEAIRNGEVDRVRAAIEAMPEPFREAVVLRDLEELSYAEIAEVTGVPVGTVMSRLSRGRAMLATALLPPGRDRDDATRSAG
jgi:RNA polymerase sigma factor (sigma-70 family)